MRNLFLLLLLSLLVFSCEKDEETFINSQQEIDLRSRPATIGVCHYDQQFKSWHLLMINPSEVDYHKKHGDKFDMDGDGYFSEPNECGMPLDCDDRDSFVKQCCFCDYMGMMDFDEKSVHCNWVELTVSACPDGKEYIAFDSYIYSDHSLGNYRYIYVYGRMDEEGLYGGCVIYDKRNKMYRTSRMSYDDALGCKKMVVAQARTMGLKNICGDSKHDILNPILPEQIHYGDPSSRSLE